MDVRVMIHLFVLAAFAIITARATYTLETQLLSYSNPQHHLANGSCCKQACEPCEVNFRICRRFQGTSVDLSSCPQGEVVMWSAASATEAGNGTIIFNAPGELYSGSFIFNPITYSGPSWSGSYQLFVMITDESRVVEIDRLVFDVTINPSTVWTNLQVTGANLVVTMQAQIRVFCNTNFHGLSCTSFCQPMDNENGHFTCDSDGNKVCLEGYTNVGDNCRTPICSPNCNLDNGYCDVPGECSCNSGWTGDNCDECNTPPGCSPDHGFCTAPNECICDEGYTGEFCDMDNDTCNHQQPCAAGSTCTNIGPDQYLCTCPPGYTGQNCTTETEECSPNPCLNGATCVDLFNDFWCQCVEGWTGQICNVNIDDCSPNPCLNGGSCSDLVNGYSCSCQVGYFGINCGDGYCDDSPCLNGGTCNALVDHYECVCVDGYFGTDCGESDCDSSPCSNEATCIPHVGSFECLCDDGYTGSLCETDIDECESSPCKNNGTCNDAVATYVCTCPRGLTGMDCDSPIPPACESRPCASGLECVDKEDGGFFCQVCRDGSCRVVDPDFVVGGSPSSTLSGVSEPASNGAVIGILVTLFLLLIVAAVVFTVLVSYYFYRRQRSCTKEINPFMVTHLGQMNVTDNPTYLPADDLVSCNGTLERAPANGQSNLAEPVYASTTVKYPSMAPIISNTTYDSLASSRDNLLTHYNSCDQLGISKENSTGNGRVSSRRKPINVSKVQSEANTQEEGSILTNPYATVDLGAVTGSELDLHESVTPANNSRGEYDKLEKPR